MINSLLAFVARRRRFFLLKLLAVFCFVMTLLLWSKSQVKPEGGNTNSIEGFEKLVGGGDPSTRFHREANKSPPISHQNSAENQVGARPDVMPSFDQEKEAEIRRKVLEENMDEFLEPVLRDVKYTEIDLNAKKVAIFDDYDEEIVDDLKRVKPGLGEKGEKANVPSYQKAVADNIMKKEAFNRLLSEMISPNRSVPDTREPA